MGDQRRTVSLAVLLYLMALLRPSSSAQPTSTCGSITLTSNTVQVTAVQSSGYASGTTMTVACKTGYVQNSGTSTTATCSGTGNSVDWSWGTSQLTCSAGCSPISLNSQTVQVSPAVASGYASGTQVTLGCAPGYIPDNATSTTATCSSGLTWSWGSTQLTCSAGCPPVTLSANTIQSSPTPANGYASGTTLTLACQSGYYQSADTATTATCVNSGASIAWEWNMSLAQLACSIGCGPITLSEGTKQVSPSNTASIYTSGTKLVLACQSGYIQDSGTSTNATCSGSGSNVAWSWGSSSLSQLTCTRVCTAPQTLRASLKYVSSKTATYTVGDTFTIGCNTGYVYSSGNESAVCSSSGAWIWNGGNNLSCVATCIPPVPGSFSSVTPASNQSLYLADDVITYDCDPGYMYASGGTTGTCIAVNTWEWSNAATAPQDCIVLPQHMGAISGLFASGTCDHYVLRPAVTDATCLISCLYDDYCDGYALVGTNCYHDRPQLASTVAAMSCQTR